VTRQPSWTGRFFEDFKVGDAYQHGLGRTITSADNIWFTLWTQNTAPIHFDRHYAEKTEFGKPLVNTASHFRSRRVRASATCHKTCWRTLAGTKCALPHPVFEGTQSIRGPRYCR
jgi:acyl dehydratase